MPKKRRRYTKGGDDYPIITLAVNHELHYLLTEVARIKYRGNRSLLIRDMMESYLYGKQSRLVRGVVKMAKKMIDEGIPQKPIMPKIEIVPEIVESVENNEKAENSVKTTL